MRLAVLFLAIAATATGCHNACQQICNDMAKVAEDCGFEVTAADKAECYDAQAGDLSKNDRATCREFGGKETVAEEWDCDELAPYFDGGGSDDTDVQ